MKNAGLEVIARTNEQEKCVNPANPKAQTPSLLRFFCVAGMFFFGHHTLVVQRASDAGRFHCLKSSSNERRMKHADVPVIQHGK